MLHLLIKVRVASRCAQKAGFQHTSPWYLGNNTTSGWCGNYAPYEREKFSPGTYWLHLVFIFWTNPSTEGLWSQQNQQQAFSNKI